MERNRDRACQCALENARAKKQKRLLRRSVSPGGTLRSRVQAKHTDVEIRSAEGALFHGHGLVLMAESDYFAAIYEGCWADSFSQVLGAVPTAALEACLEWIYTGTCTAADDLALGDILEAATYLQIRSLVDVASLEIRNCLGASTALRVWRLAASHGLEALAEVAATAACKHFKSLAVAEERMSFPVALVQALLADDRLRVGSE